MDSSNTLHSVHQSVKFEEFDDVERYNEAEIEQYFKLHNSAAPSRKKSDLNQVEDLQDNLHNLCLEDQSKVSQERILAYKSTANDLSILSMKDTLMSIIETNSVVVIQGPTGCGKTTQIPQLILDTNIKKKLWCNVIVTQPRRIAAISVAKRVSQETGWVLGDLVGYKVGTREEISNRTRLTYCTTGVLLHRLIHRKHMLDYTHVILDEIHERDQDLDFLLLVIKKLLQANSTQVKVILMSATIDVKKFAKYFSMRLENANFPAPIVKIPERRRFEICTYYLDDLESLGTIPQVSLTQPSVTQAMINFCLRIIIALDQADASGNNEDPDLPIQRHTVLIFLPGIYEIRELYNHLSSIYHNNKLWDLAILHSMISSDEQNHIFQTPPQDHRRIILSTNIAESSITVPDVKYVIDFCLIKVLTFDPISNNQSLEIQWASKANCVQRAGRTGRVMDGRVYRLVPQAFYDNILNDESTPEMLRAPLTNVILRAKILDLDEPRNLLSLSLNPPTLSNIATSILLLKEVGALVNEDDESFQQFDGKLTNLGRIMASLPLDIRISKLIMLGHVFGILRDAIILGASMAIKDIFNMTQCHPTVSSYAIHRKWARGSDSDCIATLNVYKTWQNEKANLRITNYLNERQWAQRNGVQLKTLYELNILVNDITERLRIFGIKDSVGINKIVWQAKEHDFVLQIILAGAFYPNYFIKHPQTTENYRNNLTMTLNAFDPTKTVYLRGWPMEQPGYLYAKKIQDFFSKYHGIPENQIAVSFNKSKSVFVQFRKKETVATDENFNISNFVYQAIKMRQCNVPISIKVLNENEAKKRAEYHDLWKFQHISFFHTEFSTKRRMFSKVKPELPKLDVTCIPLFIQTIINPGCFWAIVDDVSTRKNLNLVEKALNSSCRLEKLLPLSKSLIIVAAPRKKNDSLIYCRAIIEQTSPDVAGLVDVFFIDYGYSSRVQYSDLRQINDTVVLEIPCLAFCCRLAHLRSSNRISLQNRWSEISKMFFRTQIAKTEKVFGQIYSVVDSIVNVKLIVVNANGQQLNINKSLIEKGYAVKREESYLSKRNHEIRADFNNINMMSTEEKEFYEEMQYDRDDLLQYPDPPEEEDCQSSIKLKGPFSPLETELIQLTSSKKRAVVEISSVNSVLLDDDPDQLGRLLVAQSINQLTNSNISLRNTTLLPNIPGLATLLTLIFTPRIELRCDSQKIYYTGALCGLGPMDKSSTRAIYPEHDIEIPFDVEITIDDIKEINKLRFWMTTGMELDKNSIDENIINCQNRIKRILFDLIDKQRKLLSPSIDYFDYQWNRYDKLYFLSATRETIKGNCDIYPLHKALELHERDDETEKMLRHISELQFLAHEGIHKDTVIPCKLCDVKLLGLLELRLHLCSQQHQNSEETVFRQRKPNY